MLKNGSNSTSPGPPPRATTLDYAARRPQTAEKTNYRHTLLGQFDRKLLDTPPGRIALALLLAAILLIPAVQFVIKIQQVKPTLLRLDDERNRSALGRWMPTTELVWHSDTTEHPYGLGHWFPGTPIVLVAIAPLTKLGYFGAGVVWAGLKVAGFLLAMWLVVRTLDREDFAVPLGILLAAGIFSIRPIVADLQHGNLNTFTLIWLGIAWGLYVRGKDVWAGVFIALAVATKLTPALAVIYFVYKREWRVCAGAVVGLVLFFGIIPSLVLGIDRNLDYLRAWYEMLVQPFVHQGYATREIPNQSLWGVTLRLLANAGILATERMPVEQAFRAGMDSMERPVALIGRLLKPAMSATLLVIMGWLCRSRTVSRRDPRCLLEFGLVLLAMLLLSERTWKHHATTLPLVYLGVWYTLTCVDFSDRFRAWFVAGLAVQFVLLVASTEGLLGDHAAELLLDGGVICWGLLLCFVQIAVLLIGLNRRTLSRPAAVALSVG